MITMSLTDLSTLTSSAPFASEDNLISVVLERIRFFFNSDNIIAATEIPIGAGIVDIVAGQIINAKSQTYELLDGMESYMISLLHYKQRLSLFTISRKANLSPDKTLAILQQLVDKGYIQTTNNCYLRVRLPIDRVIAIEGKLKNWKKALQQANRNRLFATQSFVALEARYARPALQNLDLFKHYQVGLVIVSSEGNLQIVYRPRLTKPITPIMPIIAQASLLKRMA